MPIFPGGKPGESFQEASQRFIHFLTDSLTFPPKAIRDGVQGKVLFSFKVNAQGRTSDIKLVQGLRADVDAAVLQNAHRMDRIQWVPGMQNHKPVSVAYTVPISFNVHTNGRETLAGDSLDRGPYQKLVLPLMEWNSDRRQIPAGKGLIYGSCIQRLGGNSSLGLGEYVRLVNVSTGKAFRIMVKPAMKSRRENAFCYALPAGRYALFIYEFPDAKWGPYQLHLENIRKSTPAQDASSLQATRFQFVVEAGKLHYVGTWNLANENQPVFLDEKTILDTRIQASYESVKFGEAKLAVPR
ncbi:energy transducer TonB [Hymenobacter sp. BT683]|uniref:Energy transducer TonB n=2 Tax=Hymenobacter jeongseonensis TaxID=2791027 RepID=A0ABS0IHL8_9BACT|nr:energy transducer TonB [Hymenobacter jeongseonensis]